VLVVKQEEPWEGTIAHEGAHGIFAFHLGEHLTPAVRDPLAKGIAELGSYIRFNSLLPGADRELAICAVGRELDSHFEWVAHAPIALREGVRAEALELLRTRGSLDGLTPRERTIVEVVHALYRRHAVSDELFQRARAELGEKPMLELVALTGYYGMISFVLGTYQVPLPDGQPPPF
jgi:4-carboxymuconolactone decarboxylase